ncbi:helix-turn-helix transcriptional regulator [Arthrobacter sp. ZGTC131]|uniref:ArsR/SmtB family transcription factor n=1 Tax=Arthrobacter sp. ZGTC131 TaxID=2058898 RepID=UPI000CE40DD3|nr:metalloregulator ArsR/SmtB family transcription factor [Arthrobacter sp. ZGTC131]
MTDDMPEGVIQTEVKAELFKSMGHPARILILEMLVDGPVAVSHLRDGTGLEASNLSQHLGILRRQRLIVPSRKDGRLFYELSCSDVSGVLSAARGLLGTVLQANGYPRASIIQPSRVPSVVGLAAAGAVSRQSAAL